MEKKNIIIISVAAAIIILIAAWFIFDPMGNGNTPMVESQSVDQIAAPPATEMPKEDSKVDASKNGKKKADQFNDNEIYIVKEGDTLQKISLDYYGETKYWLKIFAANESNIDWYDDLKLGLKLVIPKLK